jgi:cytochrome P450
MPLAFDPFDPAFQADPYPWYERLRTEDPVHLLDVHLPGLELPGLWLLTRYDDVVAVLRDDRFSADKPLLRLLDFSPALRVMGSTMLTADPPAHTRLRTLVGNAFTPRMIEALRPRVQAIVDELLDAVLPAGTIDLVPDFATPLPVIVIAELLGIPAADRARFKRWSDAVVVLTDGNRLLTGLPQAEQAVAELGEYLSVVFADRRQRPREDLVSALVAARDEGQGLTDDQLLGTCILLLVAGNETTTNLIGTGVRTLLRHPAQADLVREHACVARTAVEELLRYDSPVQLTSRVARVDVRIRGRVIRAGQEVDVCLAAANRDPAQFPRADELDVTRADNPHVAFGHGRHFCLGAALARLEAQIAIPTLLRRLPDLRLETEAPAWRDGFVVRGLATLPLSFRRVAA